MKFREYYKAPERIGIMLELLSRAISEANQEKTLRGLIISHILEIFIFGQTFEASLKQIQSFWKTLWRKPCFISGENL